MVETDERAVSRRVVLDCAAAASQPWAFRPWSLLSLLPEYGGDIAMDCTCQRWPMPCAHLAAACYALARSFDIDPFGVLAWRGRG